MKILTLSLNNFLIFEKEHFIDLSGINSCIVSGVNGAGKSTLIIDTLLFAMYGQARQRGSDCITLGQESGSVIFSFEHNNDIYVIERDVVKKKISTKLKLLKNDQDISGSTVTETQKIIEEKVLGFSKDLFLTLCCSLQGQIDNFAQQTPQEKQTILSELLHYDVWINRKTAASKFLKELNEGISSLKGQVLLLEDKRKRFSVLEEEKLDAQNSLEKLHNLLIPLEKSYETALLDWQQSRSNKNMADQISIAQKQAIDIFERNANELKNIQQSKLLFDNEKLNELQTIVENNRKEYEKENSFLLQLNDSESVCGKALNLHIQYYKIEQETSYIKNVPCVDLPIHEVCPLLKNSLIKHKELEDFLKNNNIKNLQEEIDFFQTQYSWIVSKKKQILENIFNLEKNIQNVNQKIFEYTAHSKYLQETLSKESELIEQNKTLKLSIEEYAEKLKIIDDLENLEKEYKEKSAILKNHKKQIENVNITLSNIDARQKDLAEDILNLEKIEKQLLQFEQEEKEWKYIIQLYDKIPALLLEELIPVIEEEANNVLQILNVYYQIKINVFQETKTTQNLKKVIDLSYVTDNGSITFDSLSGSEKFKQALALRIALSKTLEYIFGIKIGIFIIDEGFGSLDSDGISDVKKVLEPLASQFNFFCIITHVDELKDSFDTNIVVNSGIENKIEIISH